ncbi:PilZ domain-containing protein [Methylorubrum populi]|uniref:PilZ domain-containing protein n=1 Tax=Methylorubrum populi TaxID=223967 RepID=A0A921DZC3_9HYPH|nr:PilZ domain-containing protein [Methylorubrum populi]
MAKSGEIVSGVPTKREAKRHRMLQQGRIVLGPERLLACTVRDLSRQGAQIRVAPDQVLPETFSLVIAGHDLRTMTARLCWRREDLAGVAFEDEAGPFR